MYPHSLKQLQKPVTKKREEVPFIHLVHESFDTDVAAAIRRSRAAEDLVDALGLVPDLRVLVLEVLGDFSILSLYC